ncbi:MLO-like protein 15 [Syzygium oleosum]|uniref:MLO-like protein 15 n=1 Tax=Syzygium oleosum TaxID=219896 RepID=UPI0024B8BA1B|nr:MLO-like protein 15 [Syzygium oleosum]
MADAGGYKISLESTPTWEVALVCFTIVLISITVDAFLHWVGRRLETDREWPLKGALQKIKDELMLLGVISLLLAVSQTIIGKICVSEQLSKVWLPCKKPDSSSTVANFTTSSFPSGATRGRRLLAMASNTTDYCGQKGKVAFLSVEAVHHLHIFIFVLATSHVVLCLLKIIQWKNLNTNMFEAVTREDVDKEREKLRRSYENPPGFFKSLEEFFDERLSIVLHFPLLQRVVMLKGITLLSPDEYHALYVNFVGACDPKDPGTDLRKHIMWTLQKEFEQMIEIRWYLWLFAVIFLLVNVAGWHALFWISLITLILWLIAHFNLENMIRQLAKEVAKNPTVVEISSDKFWFGRPCLVRILIHFVLFENSLQLTVFFFILFQFGFHSCIMGKVGFVVPRIAIGTLVRVWCTYRTLPLYAVIKSQMNMKEKQSDKLKEMCRDLEKIMTQYKDQSDKRIKKCLDEIKIWLKDNQMDKEGEMWIVTWISELICNRKNRGKEPNSREESTNIEPTRMDSREESVGVEITEAGGVNSTEDIEAKKSTTKPTPTFQINVFMD